MRRTRRRLLGALTLALLLLAAAACQPAVKQAPVPGRVAASGDSTAFQAMYYGSGGRQAGTWDTTEKIGLGWKTSHAQPRVTADVAGTATSPAVLVAVFGQNYARGYTADDRNSVTAFMFSPHEAACLVVVEPYAPPWVDATRQQAIADYRAHVEQIAALRPGTVLVDWKPIAEAHPEYIASDGIHLNVTLVDTTGDGVVDPPAAAVAFVDMMEQGVNSCAA